MLREQDSALAEKFLSTAFSFQAREIVLDVSLAALAAKKGLAANLPMADAIIYATAQEHQAELITSDAHFFRTSGRHADLVTDWFSFDSRAIRLPRLDRMEHRR